MRTILCGLLLTLALPAGAARAAEPAYVPLAQRLTAEQLRTTGLDQLTPEQMRLLDQILQGEQADVARRTEQDARERRAGLFDRDARQPIHAAIVGRFKGWSGNDILQLDNGQRWQVVDTPSMTLRRALENPKVTIAPGFMGAWYLQVEGAAPRAKVKRVE